MAMSPRMESGSVPVGFVTDPAKYEVQHNALKPGATWLRTALDAIRSKTQQAIAAEIHISESQLTRALYGDPCLSPELLSKVRDMLPVNSPLREAIGVQSKLIDYFVPEFVTSSPDCVFRKRNGLSLSASMLYSGYCVARHRRCCEVQAFIVDKFPAKYTGECHQHEGQEVLLCLEGEIEVHFWPLDVPVKLAKHDVVYFDGSHPHQMVAPKGSAKALSIISAADRKSVEVTVQAFQGVLSGMKSEASGRSISSASRDTLMVQVRAGIAGKGQCSPLQQCRATIDILRSPHWKEIVQAMGSADKAFNIPTLSGQSAFTTRSLEKLAGLLGREDTSDWDRPFNLNEMTRTANVMRPETLTQRTYPRRSHPDWYRNANVPTRLVQHPLFTEEQLRDTNVQLYPTVLEVMPGHTERTSKPEGHAPGDEGVELWYVIDGRLGLTWEDPDMRNSVGTGDLGPGSVVLYESKLHHVPFVPNGQNAPTTCLHVYFSRGGGRGSYQTVE